MCLWCVFGCSAAATGTVLRAAMANDRFNFRLSHPTVRP
jgi:hypothetical protein